jgi:hypothetical protein
LGGKTEGEACLIWDQDAFDPISIFELE